LIALLGALERPTRGHVLLECRDLGVCSDVELARIRRRIGFVFQDFSLISGFSVLDNIAYPLIPRGIPHVERLQRARNLLARFGMEEKLDVRASELSGGEQQRVAIARALAGQPDVLFADEPTSNLDRDISRLFIDVLKEIHAAGKTIVLTSHDPEVIAMATQVIELKGGKLVGESGGTP
jgi:putative ABC transport system ATP-binding protein